MDGADKPQQQMQKQPQTKVWAWIVGPLLVVFTVIAVFYLVDSCSAKKSGCAQQAKGNKTVVMVRANTSVAKEAKVRANVEQMAAAGVRSSMPPLAPLWWDKEEGAYMIQLQVGNGKVELVLDTGSSQVSVKGAGCMWTNCTGNSCETKECPCGTEANGLARAVCDMHYYQPAGQSLQPGERGAGTSTTLVYGSQEDTVKHYLDVISIPRMQLSCPQLVAEVPSSPADLARFAADGEEGAYQAKDVVVHRVYYIKGASSSNLFGLAQPPLHKTETSVVLQRLYTDLPMVWSIVLRRAGGWWAMGAIPCFQDVVYVPLIDPPAFNSYLTRFYIAELRSIEVGPTLDKLVKVKSKATPKYLVVDTGTTYTYTSKTFGEALDKLGYDETSWYIRLTLGSSAAPVALTYSPSQMRDPDFPQSSVLQCTPGRTLDNFDTIFPRGAVMLFGAYMMCNCYWVFDLEKQRMGVQSLTA
jgi:hypothetical protein